jgi:hypothetical protein
MKFKTLYMIYIEHAMQKPRDLTCDRSVNDHNLKMYDL